MISVLGQIKNNLFKEASRSNLCTKLKWKLFLSTIHSELYLEGECKVYFFGFLQAKRYQGNAESLSMKKKKIKKILKGISFLFVC